MKIDLFEGGRRLALIFSILIALSTLIALQPLSNTPSFYWEIADVDAKPFKVTGCQEKSISHFVGSNELPSGDVYNAYLCFAMIDSIDKTTFGVPYKKSPDGQSSFIGRSFTPGVSDYMNAVSAGFQLFDSDVYPSKWEIKFAAAWQFSKKLGLALLSFFISILFFKIIGWIFRGFVKP